MKRPGKNAAVRIWLNARLCRMLIEHANGDPARLTALCEMLCAELEAKESLIREQLGIVCALRTLEEAVVLMHSRPARK